MFYCKTAIVNCTEIPVTIKQMMNDEHAEDSIQYTQKNMNYGYEVMIEYKTNM